MAVRNSSVTSTMCFVVLIAILIINVRDSSASDDPIACSTKCTVGADSMDCWEKNENYFINQLIEIANGLAGVEVMIDRWKQEHGEPVNISNALSQIMNRVHSLEMNKGPLNDTFVDAIVEETASQVLNWASLAVDSDDFYYNYSCPTPNDYINSLWIYMFVCEGIVLVLVLVFVIVYTHRLRGEMKKHNRLL